MQISYRSFGYQFDPSLSFFPLNVRVYLLISHLECLSRQINHNSCFLSTVCAYFFGTHCLTEIDEVFIHLALPPVCLHLAFSVGFIICFKR